MTSAAIFNVGASAGPDYRQQLGVSGSLVTYSGGIILGRPLGDTAAIIDAQELGGAAVGNVTGLKVNRFGHAVVPSLYPYRVNDVILDPKGTTMDVELQSTSTKVVLRLDHLCAEIYNDRR